VNNKIVNNKNGFSLVELMIVVAVIGIAISIGFGTFINNRGATEKRAYEGAQSFIAENNINADRMTCAGDSDRDGYGTCVIHPNDGKIIVLKCPTDYFQVNWFNATSCKEDVRVYDLRR
jgi:prepilin-type N-terminal cleavage/methylation domain-containing protein